MKKIRVSNIQKAGRRFILSNAKRDAEEASSDIEKIHIVAKAYAKNKRLAVSLVKECGIYDHNMKLSKAYHS